MELRDNGNIVCKVYDTSRNAKPVATGCPTSGQYTEILWNTGSDGNWKEVARRNVTINGGGGSGNGSHTGGQNAQHMQLRFNNEVVCKVYDTSRNAKPVATGCPTRAGDYREFLWNTASDGSWTQVNIRTVTIDGGTTPPTPVPPTPVPPSSGTHTGGQNAQHMELRFNNEIVCKAYDTSRNAKPVATGCPTRAGDYREFLWNTASDGSWTQVNIRTVTIDGGTTPPTPVPPTPVPPSSGTHTGGQHAQHMELRFNNEIVCKAYHTSRNAKPVATGCPTQAGDYREFLWNTASDGSWTQVNIRTVTIDGGDGGERLERNWVYSAGGPYKIDLPNNDAWYEVRNENWNGKIVCAGQGLGECNLPMGEYSVHYELNGVIFQILQRTIADFALRASLERMRNPNPRFASTHPLYKTPSDSLSLTDSRLTRKVSGVGDEGRHSGLTSTDDPDQVGHANFRVNCQYSHFNYDDAILAAGQTHGAHLHMYFGNTNVNAFSETNAPNNSTPGSMKDFGSGTCHGFELNRSAYWMPALLDGEGNAVVPTDIIAYYKTKDVTQLHRDGMPQGLQMVGGALEADWPFELGKSTERTVDLFWSCGRSGTIRDKYATIPSGDNKCGPDELINATIPFPQCWDGDTGALRTGPSLTHVFKIDEEFNNDAACPSSHSHRMPQLSILVYWQPPADGDTSKWHLSSDKKNGVLHYPRGSTLHADWIGGWNNSTMEEWMDGCMTPVDGISGNNCTVGQTGTENRLDRLNSSEFVYSGPKYLPYPPKSHFLAIGHPLVLGS